MSRLTPLFSVVVFAASLLAQSGHFDTPKAERYSLQTLQNYCAAVEQYSNSKRPLIFAQAVSGLGPSSGWVEFSNRNAWIGAGMPRPLALVWEKDGRVVRVAITHDLAAVTPSGMLNIATAQTALS